MAHTTSASGWERADHARRLDDNFDILVIGGGVVGAGVALDAASRGLRTALVDRDDFASGTSSRSTKLLHGGVRYLPQMRFGLVREGLREQKVLEHTADYLVSPFDFVIPVYKDRGFADAPRWARHPLIFPIALRLGLWFYDRLGGRGRSKSKRRIDVAEMQRRFPRIKTDNLRHGVVYRDYQTDDARLTVMIVKTAVEHGAVAAGWMEATSVESDGSGGFLVTIADRLEGGEVAVRAKTVIAATGAFTPPTGTGDDPIPVVLSKGAHLVTPADAVGVTDSALVLPETEDERVMFVVPWLGRAVVGTTDTPYSGDPAHPLTDGDDTAYMLRHIHIYLDTLRFEPISAWSGLRALAERARDHPVGPGIHPGGRGETDRVPADRRSRHIEGDQAPREEGTQPHGRHRPGRSRPLT